MMAAAPDEPSRDEPSEPAAPAAAEPVAPGSVDFHFVLAPEDAAHFAEKIDRLSGVAPTLSEFRIVCLDSRDDAFARLGLCYGLKSNGGPARQNAWRKFVAPLSKATPRGARRSLKELLQESGRILAVARIETQRRRWALRLGESRAEVMLDSSIVQVNGKQIALAAVTFSSKAPSEDVFSFIAAACGEEKLRLSAESELLRVFRLRGSTVPQHVPSLTPELNASMNAAGGFRAIASACFEQFLLNESLVRANGDREAVHQCRVALRRLSACFRFFSAFLTGDDFEAIKKDFKEIRAALRKARDLHVLLADVVAPAITVDPPTGGKALIRELEGQRDAAQAELAALLQNPRSANLFLRFAFWVQKGEWTRDRDPEAGRKRSQPLVKFAKRRLARMNETFLESCAQLAEMSDEERHHTRISAKNLRYAAEFFQNLTASSTGKDRYRAFLKGLKELQTVLGDWNDILMARRFFAQFVEQASKEGDPQAPIKGKRSLSAAKALAARITAVPDTEFRDKSAKACQSLLSVKPFWDKLS